jgi:hypothetical protein
MDAAFGGRKLRIALRVESDVEHESLVTVSGVMGKL